jgi:signal transduction histidine kinase
VSRESRRASFPRSIALVAIPAAAWLVLAWLHADPVVPAGVQKVGVADRVAVTSDRPPDSSAPRVRRTLPDDWRIAPREDPPAAREAWYALRFTVAPADDVPWAVYVPALRMNAAVFLDGELVGDGGRLDDPIARHWRQPLLVELPGERLAPGTHELWIQLRADRDGAGLLGPVYMGPIAALLPLHARRAALVHDAVGVITLCLVVAAAFTGALWLQWREPAYGWFAATAIAWAAMHLNLLVVDVPATSAVWDGLWWVAALGWFVTLVRFLRAFGDAGALSIATPSVLAVTVAACALHDALVLAGLAGPTYDLFLPYAAPPVFLGMGWVLLRRFVDALRATAALVADLEERVARKRAELAASWGRLQVVERARVLAEERERIMREMHDGLGSHLVSTLALLENDGTARESVARAVRAALDDLRLMVDALEPHDGDLVGALAMLRARLQPRLEAAGIRVEWRVGDVPRMPELGARAVLQILRVLQEAVTNVVKHAEARTLTIRTAASNGTRPAVAVEVTDDGRGFDAATPGGRGLHHMRRRAADIGAALAIESTRDGTRVSLAIPCVP